MMHPAHCDHCNEPLNGFGRCPAECDGSLRDEAAEMVLERLDGSEAKRKADDLMEIVMEFTR